jgi:hypothetical protein
VTLGSTVAVKGAAGTSAALSAVPGGVYESPGQRGSAWASVTRGALGGIRTPNLLIRSQMLYPLSYERRLNPR